MVKNNTLLALTLIFILSGACSSQELKVKEAIPKGSQWQYYLLDRYPGSDWYEVVRDKDNWGVGQTYFATEEETGSGGYKTKLEQNGKRPYATYYFKKKFNISDKEDLVKVDITIDYDDHYMIYLNGQEYSTSSKDCAWSDHDKYCGGGAHNSLLETVTNKLPGGEKLTIQGNDLSLLKQGENQIAVGIKQYGPKSSDAAFMLTLKTTTKPKKETLPYTGILAAFAAFAVVVLAHAKRKKLKNIIKRRQPVKNQ